MIKHITLWMTCFCIASLSAVIWPVLPHPFLLTGCWLLSACGQLIYRHHTRHVLFVPTNKQKSLPSRSLVILATGFNGLLLGALWMASLGYWYISWQQPSINFKQDKVITITVIQSSPLASADPGCKVKAQLHSQNELFSFFKPRVRLYWQLNQPCPQQGDTFRIQARLKPVTFLRNPGSSDKARQLLSQRIVYTGQIKAVLSYNPSTSVNLHTRVSRMLLDLSLPNEKWTLALLTGYRQGLSAQDWQILQKTGTAHVFSISGMHLGLVAVWAALFVRVGGLPIIWAANRAGSQPNIKRWVTVFMLLSCVAYTALANWQLPVTRALLLIVVFVLSLQCKVHLHNTRLAVLMLFCCVLIFPYAIFGMSLYLSLGAVLWLWLLHWRIAAPVITIKQKLLWAATLQVALSVGLVPVTIGFFDVIPMLAIVFNLLLLPVIALLLPMGLLALLILWFSAGYFTGPVFWFDHALGWLVSLLTFCIEHAPAVVNVSLTPSVVIATLLGLIILLCPPFLYKKRAFVVLMTPLLLSSLSFNNKNWYLHVVDVGQGSSLLLSRAEHAILIDTGPASPYGASVFTRQTKPLLNYLGLQKLDEVFISHSDNDHAGGIGDIEMHRERYRFNSEIITAQNRCQQGYLKQWQGLVITALWPKKGNMLDNNNHSCVLNITDGSHSVLIAGDIERTAEYALLYTNTLFDVDVLIAPHHGSATSSGQAFVDAVSPDHVVFTTARDNRWQFPHRAVVKRYQQANSTMHNTADSGYIRFTFEANKPVRVVNAQTLSARWYHAGASARVWPVF
ncbi:DNA internalization-related competence protein ComEC/Rec2 [Alteromonas lipotrueiana]|uniref:DNA internalization-related competence protein ComEC/Rec2 n=1 Tax=Alteromonas lipotrueiana TaxID=2803815 RepID=UPI001C44596E|nr:DNA internalization-related competence protein ComEC/Rec2 [Alteromonas lipotrueiana]